MSKVSDEYYTWGMSYDGDLTPWCLGVKQFLEQDDRIKFLSIHQKDDRFGFIADFYAEVPQRPPIDIKRPERVVIIVGETRMVTPTVCCLRKSFPTTPHVFLCASDEPTKLCLSEEDYSNICHDFTPRKLIEQIFHWLQRASVNQLHLPDQPLEPFIFSRGTIIISQDIFSQNTLIECQKIDESLDFLMAVPVTDESIHTKRDVLFFPIKCNPHHGVFIRHIPHNFDDLCELMRTVGIDLKVKFYDYVSQYHQNLRKSSVIIGLEIPKTRIPNGRIESTDYLAFLVGATLEDIAKKLGILTNVTGTWQTAILINHDKSQIPSLHEVQVSHWKVRFHLSKNMARKISRIENETQPSILLIGVGSLGSQVALNLSRQGFGKWSISDEDRLLPHNLPRHGLPHQYIGWKKSHAVTNMINDTFNGTNEATVIPHMLSDKSKIEFEKHTKDSDVFMDFSASDSVLSCLASLHTEKPCLSGFLNHTAEIGVVLYEGKKRQIHIDELYQQFFTTVAFDSQFEHYFAEGNKIIAYPGSCRDLSFQVSGDFISLQAAAISTFVRLHLFDNKPSIHLWEWQSKTMTLKHKKIKVFSIKKFESNDWTIKIFQNVLTQIKQLRTKSAQRETGGILLGKFDLNNKQIYVSYLLTANDSVEKETCFIRGNHDLQKKINDVNRRVKSVYYVGEWHTHPIGCPSKPSQQDKKTLNDLQVIMSRDMLPTLIFIQGDEAEPYVEVCA
jgi:integrative and conjugative element protein (TIGR02256 family)